MGHEQDVSANPWAMSYNFQLGEHCQVCQHPLLYMCGTGADIIRCGTDGKLTNNKSRLLKPTTCSV